MLWTETFCQTYLQTFECKHSSRASAVFRRSFKVRKIGDLYDVFVLVKFGAMNLRKLNSTVTLLVNFETPLLKSLIIFNILLLLALFYDSSTKQKKAVVKCTKNSYTSIFIVSKNVWFQKFSQQIADQFYFSTKTFDPSELIATRVHSECLWQFNAYLCGRLLFEGKQVAGYVKSS